VTSAAEERVRRHVRRVHRQPGKDATVAQVVAQPGVPPCLKDTLTKGFGTTPLSDIKVHDEKQVDKLSASAFSAGTCVCFASSVKDDLLGHELVHVVQQRCSSAK